MIETTLKFMLVDDDELNNTLSKMVIKKVLDDVEVTDFLEPNDALNYIQAESSKLANGEIVTLFLDINMPSISGWEFLDLFDAFTDRIKNQFNIYILSSSIDPADISRAKLNPLVVDFVEKPMKKAILSKIFESEVMDVNA